MMLRLHSQYAWRSQEALIHVTAGASTSVQCRGVQARSGAEP